MALSRINLGIIGNPFSGAVSTRHRYEHSLTRELEPGDELVWTHDESSLVAALTAFRDRDFQWLGILGGDGSIRLVLSQMVHVWRDKPLPKILMLRGGTMNVVSYSFGLRGNPIKVMRKFRRRRRDSQPIPLTTGRLQRVGSTYGFIFGLGTFTYFLHEYYKKERPSPWWAARLTASVIVSGALGGSLGRRVIRKTPVSVTTNSKVIEGEKTLLACSSVRHAGFHFMPFYYSQNPDQPLHLLTSEDHPAKLAMNVYSFFRGRPPIFPSKIVNLKCEQLTIEAKSNPPVFIDGDIMNMKYPIEIGLGPLLQIVTP